LPKLLHGQVQILQNIERGEIPISIGKANFPEAKSKAKSFFAQNYGQKHRLQAAKKQSQFITTELPAKARANPVFGPYRCEPG
jgi:hypothetical protein